MSELLCFIPPIIHIDSKLSAERMIKNERSDEDKTRVYYPQLNTLHVCVLSLHSWFSKVCDQRWSTFPRADHTV